jgi:hypothetical protein
VAFAQGPEHGGKLVPYVVELEVVGRAEGDDRRGSPGTGQLGTAPAP